MVASRWYTTAAFRKTAFLLLALVVVIESYVAVFKRQNDFQCHRHSGQAFLAGDPYGNGNELYPVGRCMLNTFFALEPLWLARGLTLALALGGLYLSFRCWQRMADASAAVPRVTTLAAAVFAVLMLLPYLLRDMDECGLQLLVLFFLTAAGYALFRGRHAGCGFWLATATTYKVAPLLFLPFLLWKRQFRAASWLVVFLAAWTLAPAAYLGWDMTVRSYGRFVDRMGKTLAMRKAYPEQAEAEPPKPQNLSLQAALARYLETYPPGHPLHLNHAWFFQFGAFAPLTAYYLVRAGLLILALILAWRFRHSWAEVGRAADFAPQWAAMCLLCALLSPICWKQHLVLGLPAAFLVLRSLLSAPRPSRFRIAALVLIGAIVCLSRHAVVGRELAIVLNSYKVDTFAVLLLLGLVLTVKGSVRPVAAEHCIPTGRARAA